MIAREQDRSLVRHAFGMKTLDAPEIKPQPQADDSAHQGIQAGDSHFARVVCSGDILLFRAAQGGFLDAFNEINEAAGLRLQSREQFRVVQPSAGIDQAVDLWEKDALRIDPGVAIAKNLLELLDG